MLKLHCHQLHITHSIDEDETKKKPPGARGLSSKQTNCTPPSHNFLYIILLLFATGKRKRSAQSPVFDKTSFDEAVLKPPETGMKIMCSHPKL